MAAETGSAFPDVTLAKLVDGKPTAVKTGEYFKGKKVVLFGVPFVRLLSRTIQALKLTATVLRLSERFSGISCPHPHPLVNACRFALSPPHTLYRADEGVFFPQKQ